MLAHSFAIGTGTVFFETAASALFLARFDPHWIPWVYLAGAAVSAATGFVYTALQERVRFRPLMLATLAFLLGAVLALRGGLLATGAAWLTFGLLVFYRILSSLTDFEFWAVAGRLYDVRQAKRLFGLIGSGEALARMAGAFAVPLLVSVTGVADLLLVSAAGLAGALALVSVLTAGADGASPRGKPTEVGLRRAIDRAREPYLALVLGITVFAVLSKYFVDFAFLEQLKARYDGAQELAGFFGLYSGATQALSLVTRALLSGPLLSRFGIRVGLVVLPLAHLACTLLLIAAGAGSGPAGAAFWLVMANQGIYKVLKHPIDNPSFRVLYQPLRPRDRLAAQILVETIVTPLGAGVAGAAMLLFTAAVPYHPVSFASVMLVIFAAWAVLGLRAGRAYPKALSDALGGRIAGLDLDFSDERSLEALRGSLGSDRPGEVLSALGLLERAGARDLGGLVAGLLEHPAPEVRASALERLEALGHSGAVGAVRRRAREDPSPRVRAAAVRCLCSLGGAAAGAEAAPYLDDPDPLVRRSAFVGLLRGEADLAAASAAPSLADRARSSRPEVRVWAAEVIGEAGRRELSRFLPSLLKDDVSSVRRAALRAAGKLGEAGDWPAVVASLGARGYAPLASRALVAGGELVLPAIEAEWRRGLAASVRVALARALGSIGGGGARALLRRHAADPDPRVRDAVLAALVRTGYQAAEPERGELVARVRAEAGDAAWSTAARDDLSALPEAALLRQALELQFRQGRDRVLLLLTLLLDPTAIQRARGHLADASKEKRAYALEVLDVTLPRELRGIVLPLCEEPSSAGSRRRLEPELPPPRLGGPRRLEDVLAQPAARVTPWTRATALHALGRLGARAARLGSSLEELRGGAGEPIVRETAEWARSRLVEGAAGGAAFGAGEGRRPMLTVEKVVVLKSVPMFARATEEELADVAAILEEVRVGEGETVFRKGEMGNSLYVIVEGRVRVFDGERTIAHLGERDVFGELALLDPEPRNASIEAVEATHLLRLDQEAFSELMAGNIDIVRGVLAVLCERLRRTTA